MEMKDGIQNDETQGRDSEEQPRKRPRLSSQLAREVGLMRNVPGDNHPGFVGSASGIYFIRSVYAALRRSQHSTHFQGDTPSSEVVPGEDDHLPSIVPGVASTLWRAGEVVAAPAAVRFYDLVELTGSYFSNWHPFFPFLHAPTVLQYFEALSHEETTQEQFTNNLQMVIIKAITSISLADRRQSGQSGMAVPSNLFFNSYDAAIDSLQDVFSKPTSELGLQAAISVQLFLVSMLRLNAASRLGGLINRMAVQVGLHRCPTRYSTFASSEKDMRKRIFWSLYTIDRFICQSMGLPLGLNDDDVDVCFPGHENHLSGPDYAPDDSKLVLLSFVARQSRLRGEIIELRNKSLKYVQKNPDQAVSISAHLSQWWNDIEDHNDSAGTRKMSQYHLTVLTLLKHESVISLHRPVLAAAQKGSAYDAALQLCIGSARSIITTLHNCIGQSNAQITLLWPSCTWAVWISTFVLFYAANGKHLSSDIVARLADRSLEILQHLARRGSAWPEASAAAIRDLRARMMDAPKENYINRSQYQGHSQPDEAESGNSSTQAGIVEHSSNSQIADYGLPRDNWDSAAEHIQTTMHLESATEAGPVQQAEQTTALRHNHDNIGFDESFSEHALYNAGQSDNTELYGSLDSFSGFDIPFWFDQDQQWDIFQDFN